jgi:multiple sugar transport system permease protein
MAVVSAPVSAPPPTLTPAKRRINTRLIGTLAILGIAAVLTLGPVIWTLIRAVTPQEAGQPKQFGFSAFKDVFDQIDMVRLVINSTLVTFLIVIGQMFTAALAGYVFARVEFRGRGLLFGLVLATMMVPLQVTIVPVFMIIRGIGLSDTLMALILPAIPTAFGTFLMRQYFLTLPAELGEAASIDGAGPFRTFWSVYAPLATPALAVVGILAFNYHWNEFFRPLIFEISEENYTLPLGLVTLQGNLGTGSVSTVLAGVVLSMIPAVLVFIFGQRRLREGLTAGIGK